MLTRNTKIVYLLIGLVCYCANSGFVSAANLQCYHCDGEDCDDPTEEACPDTSNNEQCYIRLDVNNDFIGMGCASTLGTEAEVAALIQNKSLYVCSTENCNGYESLPQTNACHQCNSGEDARCATQPQFAGVTVRCANVPYTSCYERVSLENNGTTERGCLYELEGSEFYDCLTGADANCRVCAESACNLANIPADRPQCQRCDSETDSSCNSAPSALSVCPRYLANDKCVSLYESGVTRRGCSSEFSCDSSAVNCEVCTGSGCNKANLQKRTEDLYGIFQDLPLTCNTCEGTDCLEGGQHLRVCEGHIYQDCVTIFDALDNVVSRGCELAVYADYQSYCETNPELCFNCKSNGCNNFTEVATTQQCIYCDSSRNPDCVSNVSAITTTRRCIAGCVTALYESNTNEYQLARTCFEDMEFDDRATCTDENNCVECEGDGCNTAAVPAEGRLSCLHCDGDDCDEPVARACSVYSQNDMCYMYFDPETNSAIRMGCKTSVSDSDIYNDAKHYFLCDGDNCNNYDNLPKALICYVCDSVEDARCATQPTAITTTTSCSINPHTDCFARVDAAGNTVRGCVSSLNNTDFIACNDGDPDAICLICTENNCNGNVYPSSRQRCHRCNSADDDSCERDLEAESICPIYDENDYCVSKLVGDVVYRGCGTDLQCDKDSTNKTCSECDDFYCNTKVFDLPIGNPGYFQPLPLSCYHCDGTAACSDSLGELKQCENNIYQTCTTVFNVSTGFLTARGCSDTLEEVCDGDSSSCYNCKSNQCNVATLESEYIDCIFCDSSGNDACVTNVTDVKKKRKCYKSCVTTLYNRTDDATPVRELIRTCLDDLESVDQDICYDGNDANCKACSSSKCNTDIVGTRISCYQCVGDECQDPQPKTCRAVSESDHCFVQYDETASIVELGCESNYDPAEVKELIVAKRLWLCEGDNCNTFEATPSSQRCTICSSATDLACATEPNTVQSDTSCARVPYTQCYSRVLDSGYTERGCLSSIQGEEFYDCVVSGTNSTKCLTCSGANCNKELFPANRRSCHRCNSLQNSTCESSPSASSICPLYNADEYCVVKLVNDDTYRGCSSELTCSDSDSQNCRSCTGKDNCNTADLVNGNIGEPGKWQDLPLNCFTCELDECTDSVGLLRKCENNNLQICQTVFATNGTVLGRGCSDNIAATYNEYCDSNSNNCIGCKSNGCNTATSLEDYVDCYTCDSTKNSTCAVGFVGAGSKTRKCLNSCAVLLYPRSSVEDPSYELERTCLDDMDLDDREDCLAGNNEFCLACNGSLCNTGSLPANRHTCYKCVDEECTDYAISECSAYHPNDQCYIMFDEENSVMNMGCRSEYEQDIVTELVKQKLILVCDGVACNGPDSIPITKTCSVCDSSADPRCATNPNLVSDLERCTSLPYTDCFTRIDEDGHTIRGCLSNLPSNTFYNCLTGNDSLCETCSSNRCNGNEVFPTERWQCHHCSSDIDPICSTAPNNNTICPIYKETDQCVTSWYNGVTTRGCASSLPCDEESDKGICRVCNTTGCNTINIGRLESEGHPGRWQDVPITCRTCEGAEDCQSLGIYRVCTGDAYQSCSTVFHTNGSVIARGCSDAINESNSALCDVNPERCPRCNSNGCNDATSLSDYIDCYYCDADVNGNCIDNVSAVTTKRTCNKYCMTALYSLFEETNPAYGLSRSCYDDMDLDDREACVAGTKEYCSACSGANCNTQLLPESRLSCYACKGDECQDPQASKCVNYREGDKCYIEYDEQRSIIGMGCRSEYTNANADYLLQNKRLFYCEGDNCNTYSAIPATQYCALCSSRTDIKCATDPNNITGATSCSFAPYTQCYSRVLTSGVTERGCLSSLYDEEFASCLNGTDAHCESCSGNYCNKKLYPDNRLSCHICDSTTNPDCATEPNNLSICPLYEDDDTCVTAYSDGVTYRGCSSSIACDANDTKTCAQCTGDGCNTINLERYNDDNYGKWQDLPLTCLSCRNNDCNSSSSTQSLVCDNNNEQDCVTVFADGQVVGRGCSDVIEQEYALQCNSNPDDCLYCKSNTCNNATAKTQYTECIYCDTHKNLSCLWDAQSAVHQTRLCQGSCMTALYPTDSSADPAYELIRTCLDDKEAADRNTCTAGRDALCQSCTGSKCNSGLVPANRTSCYQCNDENCDEPVVEICPLYKSDDKCYIWFDETNSVTQMGCLSSFRNQELETIIGTKRIIVCEGDDCNSLDTLPTPHQCAVCDSNTDYECATNAQEIGTLSTCSQYPYTNCYTKLNSSDGSTARGCLSDLATQDFVGCVLGNDGNCSICIGDGCNREVFPADRQQCYTCSSADEAACESDPTRLLPCPYVTDTEQCRTAFDGNLTVRGCSSEVYCDIYDKNCRSCYGTGCNQVDLANRPEDDGVHGVWQELPLRCHTCEGDNCLYSLGPAYNCTGNLEQDCATVFTADGEVKRRGCSEDVEDYEQRYCKANPELCFTCKSNECNDAWNITDYIQCNFCSSETDPLCATDPENGEFNKRACQKECMVALKDSHVIRSCLDDKEYNHRYVCRENESGDECASCDTPDCNNFIFPADRQSCHVCSDSTCSSSKVQYCDPYDIDDYCFVKYEDGRPELLGCASSQNSSDLEAWEAENKLYTCQSNNCNALSNLPSTGGYCLSCSSDQTPACAQNPESYTIAEACPGQENQCVTYLSQGLTRRGCLSNLSEAEQSSCQASGTCSICTGNRCNNEVFPSNRRKCHICNSSSDSSCIANPAHLQICPLYLNNDSCVTKQTDYIERGCLSQLTCDTSDEANCQVCNTDGCNTAQLTTVGDGALVSTASLLMTSVFAIVAMLVHRFN